MIGFVYLWFDSGRNSESAPGRRRWCLGSHYGSEDDGYVTSTGGQHFKAAYRKRPQDFKRRIIQRIYEGNGRTVLNAEQRWLDLIKSEELLYRYYNRKKSAAGLSREDILRIQAEDPTITVRQGKSLSATYAAKPELRYQMGKYQRDAYAADPIMMAERMRRMSLDAYAADPTLKERVAKATRDARAADPTIGLRVAAASRAWYAGLTEEQKREHAEKTSVGRKASWAKKSFEQRKVDAERGWITRRANAAKRAQTDLFTPPPD